MAAGEKAQVGTEISSRTAQPRAPVSKRVDPRISPTPANSNRDRNPPPARIAPAQRAAHEATGTLRRHATCSPAARPTPPPAPFNMPASRQTVCRIPTRTMRHNPCLRASCPKCQARCASSLEPRSSFACPRPATSPLRACPPPRAMWLRAVVGLRRSAPFASLRHAPAPPPPHAGRAQAAPRCFAAPTRAERVRPLRAAVGNRASRPAASASCGRCGGVGSPPLASVALRAKSAAAPPRFARTTPRPASAAAFASLSPPRETSRSFGLPLARGGGASLPPSNRSHRLSQPLRPPSAAGAGVARVARARVEQGRSPPCPRSSLGSGVTCCALRLPAGADLRRRSYAGTATARLPGRAGAGK